MSMKNMYVSAFFVAKRMFHVSYILSSHSCAVIMFALHEQSLRAIWCNFNEEICLWHIAPCKRKITRNRARVSWKICYGMSYLRQAHNEITILSRNYKIYLMPWCGCWFLSPWTLAYLLHGYGNGVCSGLFRTHKNYLHFKDFDW